MARVNREQFLTELESVRPGLSVREILEQSSCYVFKAGKVMTYNDEVACSSPTMLGKDLQGAVQADPLLAVLRKLQEDEIEVEAGDGELLIRGKGRRAGIVMEKEILLPIDVVEKPDTWQKLHPDFSEAIGIVSQCSSKDESRFSLTCVHITPKWVEACDNFQLARWRLKTGVEKPTLVRHSAIKHIVSLGMTELAETDSWIHFRASSGLTLSCRRYIEDFPDLTDILKLDADAKPMSMPKGLGEAADKAQIFSSENTEANHVLVELQAGKLRVRGQGVSGWYTETKKLKYDGESMSFLISPQLLMDLVKRHNECQIAPERLKVQGDKYVYVSCLSKPPKASKAAENGEAK